MPKKTCGDCNDCLIASCEERQIEEVEPYFNEEYEYEKMMDNQFHKMFGGDPAWSL